MSDSVRPHRRQPTRLLHPWDSPGKNTGVGCHFLLQCMKVKIESEVAQSCLPLCDHMDYSLPGASIHGIFQARVLKWGASAFSDLSNDKCLIQWWIHCNPWVNAKYYYNLNYYLKRWNTLISLSGAYLIIWLTSYNLTQTLLFLSIIETTPLGQFQMRKLKYKNFT